MDADRVNTTKADIEDPGNYDTGTGHQDLSTVAFTGSISLPVELQSFSIE